MIDDWNLKPCPFCGSEVVSVVRIGDGRQSCIVSCENCGCRMESNESGAGNFWNDRAEPKFPSTGLCDSHGREIRVGDIVRHHTDFNTDVHGPWCDYEVRTRGLTPVLFYQRSQKGQVLPVDYTAGLLAERYDVKMFLLFTNLDELRPLEPLKVVATHQNGRLEYL